MATIHFHLTTTATPGRLAGGPRDVALGRSEDFGTRAGESLQIYDEEADDADVSMPSWFATARA